MGSKIAVSAIALIGFIAALVAGHFGPTGTSILWAAAIFTLSILPAFLGLFVILRLVHPESREFVYNQVLFGGIPGLLTIYVVGFVLAMLATVLIFYKEFGAVVNAADSAQKIHSKASEELSNAFDDAVMSPRGQLWNAILISVLYAAVWETGKYLMGHRVKGATSRDPERSDMNLVVASFISPVLGLFGMVAIFTSMVKIMLNPSISFIFLFFLHDLLHCAIDIGTALFMGLSACKMYVLQEEQKGYVSLAISVTIRYLYMAIPGTLLALKGKFWTVMISGVHPLSLSLFGFQIAVLAVIGAVCRRVYHRTFPSDYVLPTSQSSFV